MLATDWKSEHGYCLQVGLEGVIDELNWIAAWLAENRDMETWCIDDLKNSKSSILDGLKSTTGAHYLAPPTVNGRVRIYKTAPPLNFPILFLHVATTDRVEIEPVVAKVRAGTVVYGTADACRMVLEAAQCKAQPLYYHGDRIVVRAA